MSRAITSDELTALRADGQWTELFLAIHQPAVVFAARVNQSFSTTDEIPEVTYDTVTTGGYADIVEGQTCYVGSSAGAYDIGMVRIRKSPTSTKLYIGVTSEIEWADNLYLTVVNEFNLWAKHWNTPSETAVYMDWDIGYVDQNTNFSPVPVIGPDIVLVLDETLTLPAASITATAADSWVIGSTIIGWSWSTPGAMFTDGSLTESPTITYITPGMYQISCTVTAANGQTATGHRTVFVYSSTALPVQAFTLDNCVGDSDNGGWQFDVTMYDQAALSSVRDRAKVILFSRDFYAGAEGSLGPLASYEKVIASGWIDDESIDWDAEQGSVQFSVKGPAYWMSKLAAYPGGLKLSEDVPTSWRNVQSLTVNMFLQNLYHWRSTLDAIMDCYPNGDTRIASGLTTSPGSLWSQLKEISERILAEPLCDRFGRLFVETDSQYLLTGARTSIPIIQAITAQDWTDKIRIPRKAAGQLAMLETGGTDYASPYFSRSYGKIPGVYGSIETRDNMLVADQNDLNAITGMIVARRNNQYPQVTIRLAANNRFIDIAPSQYVTLSVSASDTERGIVWTDKKFIPRRVYSNHDIETGCLLTELECEAYTSGPEGRTVIPPAPSQTNIPPVTPPIPPVPIVPPPIIWYPPIVPPSGTLPPCGGGVNGPFSLTFSPTTVNGGGYSYAYFPCTIHPSGSTHETELHLPISASAGVIGGDNMYVSAVNDSRVPIASGIAIGGGVWKFGGAGDYTAGGFQVWLDAFSDYSNFTPGAIIQSGMISANDATGASISVTPGQWYALESSGGPWDPGSGYANTNTIIGVFNTSGGQYGDGGMDQASWVQNGIVERINTSYARIFLMPTETTILIRVPDTLYTDNAGAMSYTLRAATADEAYVMIGDATIYNVCRA